jgi:hypothetical protein
MNTSNEESTGSEENYENFQTREITEEEFDPIGTMALTILYFVLITALWFFMYFVEFASHGPSILS